MNPEFQSAILAARISRRIKLSPEARKEHKRKQNNKLQTACRMRRIAEGLRGDGKVRKRPYRERVHIQQVQPAKNGEVWVLLSAANAPRGVPPVRKLKRQMSVVIVFDP